MRGLPSSFLLSTFLVRGFTLLHTKEESGRIAISTLKTVPDLVAEGSGQTGASAKILSVSNSVFGLGIE